MWLKSIQLKNIKSFVDSGPIVFSKGINLLVGPNNSGKSTILRAIYSTEGFENPSGGNAQDFLIRFARFGHQNSEFRIELEDSAKRMFQFQGSQITQGVPAIFEFKSHNSQFFAHFGMPIGHPNFHLINAPSIFLKREPDNFIHPFFARRRPAAFNLTINEQHQNLIEEVFDHIPAKLDKFTNPRTRGYAEFKQICLASLGLEISTAVHAGGKQAGFVRDDGKVIPIDQMGDGTFNVISLLAHLCGNKGKLFLIEEMENDIHLRALKTLLEFIIKKSEDNQFIISTHSNIVVGMLGGAPGAIIHAVHMSMDHQDEIPTSTCTRLDDGAESRLRLLESLGYQPSDLYFYNAYLVLEESTAERIIRDFLIPNLFPKLRGRLRTIAAGGVTNVEPYFNDFFRLFVYLHTTEPYRNRAWAAVDGGADGQKVIIQLQEKFKDWKPSRFRCFEKQKFEDYYPPRFAGEKDTVLRIAEKQQRQKEKGRLVEKVLEWCSAQPDEAIQHFKSVAPDVIALLA